MTLVYMRSRWTCMSHGWEPPMVMSANSNSSRRVRSLFLNDLDQSACAGCFCAGMLASAIGFPSPGRSLAQGCGAVKLGRPSIRKWKPCRFGGLLRHDGVIHGFFHVDFFGAARLVNKGIGRARLQFGVFAQ